jgi:hypothetical protein
MKTTPYFILHKNEKSDKFYSEYYTSQYYINCHILLTLCILEYSLYWDFTIYSIRYWQPQDFYFKFSHFGIYTQNRPYQMIIYEKWRFYVNFYPYLDFNKINAICITLMQRLGYAPISKKYLYLGFFSFTQF